MSRIFQAVASLIACTLSVPNLKVGLGKNLALFPHNEYVHKCRIRQKKDIIAKINRIMNWEWMIAVEMASEDRQKKPVNCKQKSIHKNT